MIRVDRVFVGAVLHGRAVVAVLSMMALAACQEQTTSSPILDDTEPHVVTAEIHGGTTHEAAAPEQGNAGTTAKSPSPTLGDTEPHVVTVETHPGSTHGATGSADDTAALTANSKLSGQAKD